MPHATAVTGVTYSLRDTQSSLGCPCQSWTHPVKLNKHTTYVSYSAVNISVIATNAAGPSPPAIIQVPAEPAADLESMCVCVCSCMYHVYSSLCRLYKLLFLSSSRSLWHNVTGWKIKKEHLPWVVRASRWRFKAKKCHHVSRKDEKNRKGANTK